MNSEEMFLWLLILEAGRAVEFCTVTSVSNVCASSTYILEAKTPCVHLHYRPDILGQCDEFCLAQNGYTCFYWDVSQALDDTITRSGENYVCINSSHVSSGMKLKCSSQFLIEIIFEVTFLQGMYVALCVCVCS